LRHFGADKKLADGALACQHESMSNWRRREGDDI
jgi:hypothetical protein